MSTKTVQMNNNLNAIKKQKEPSSLEKEKIQSGLNQAGQKAVQEMEDPKLKSVAEIMARRLGKLDVFIEKLVQEEGSENLSPQQVTELLMIKARHNAFIHTAEADNSKILLWLIEMVLYNADAIFAVTKAHLVAQDPNKEPEIAEIPQKQEKKSRKEVIKSG